MQLNGQVPLSIIVPAYNEVGRISGTLAWYREFLSKHAGWRNSEVIVVCDGCTDGTANAVRALDWPGPYLRVIEYSPNRGKGYALRQGVAVSRGDMVLMADADGTTPLSEAIWMSELLKQRGADMVVGSRRAVTSRLEVAQPWRRRLLGKLFSFFVGKVLGLSYRDTQCGFKLFRGHVARRLFGECRCDHYAIDVELLYRAKWLGLESLEVGIIWRNGTNSHVRPFHDGVRMLIDALRIRSHVSRLAVSHSRVHTKNRGAPNTASGVSS